MVLCRSAALGSQILPLPRERPSDAEKEHEYRQSPQTRQRATADTHKHAAARGKHSHREPRYFEESEASDSGNFCRADWEWEDLTNSKHYQLAGKVHGKGVVGGRTIEFDGYGERDRAWGDRNYGPLKVSLWNVVQFPDDVAIHAFSLMQADGTYRLHGYIHKDGVTRGIAKFESEIVYAGPKGPPENGRIRYTDDLGRVVEVVSFQRKNHLALGAAPDDGGQLDTDQSKSQSLMFLTFQRFTRADGTVGHGMIDYNCHVGNQPASMVAVAPPLYSTLYPFGR